MKTPSEISSKIKQVRFEYLKAAYQIELTRHPCNCIYNRKVTLHGEGEVVTRLCGFYSDDKNYIVCDTEDSARNCDAFVCKKSKKQVREQLEKDMIENSHKYPELLALEWVLEKKSPIFLITKFDVIVSEIKRLFVNTKAKIQKFWRKK